MSVSDICEVFFTLENKYNLNYRKIQGCFFWQLIRMYLYYEIARKTNTFGTAQQQILSVFDKIKSFLPFIKNSILYSPFRGSKKDYLIFDHPRKTLFNGTYTDIYSSFLTDFLDNFEVMESPYLNKHISDKKPYTRYTDRIQLGSYFYKKFHKIEFSKDEMELIENISNDLNKAFNIEINLSWIISTHILNFKYDYKKYTELFKKKSPKKIFVVVGYENQAVICSAKDLGIEVIELQHGTITDYHLGYSYPKKTRLNGEIKYFPDKILTFGDYWINEDTCPLSKEDIIPTGFSYFEIESKDFTGLEKDLKKILFISQGVIGKHLSEIAYQTACELKDYEIIYKLHPGEYATWREMYPQLVNDLDNFKVIDNSKTPLYQLFATSTYQVGAFSTAIYEGLMFNCKTFIVDVPGIEYLDDLIEKDYVFKINSSSQLIDNLDKFTPKAYDKNFFFKDFDEKLLCDVIFNE